MFEWRTSITTHPQMWVAYWKDQTVFGPFFSTKEADEQLKKSFGPNYREFIEVWAVERLNFEDYEETYDTK